MAEEQAKALQDENARLNAENESLQEEIEHRNGASAQALNELWKKIILEKSPNYGDWEYPMQAMRHIVCEFSDLNNEIARLKALLEHSKTQLEYDELQAENAKLKKALKRYGHHDSPCATLIDDDIYPCFCGFKQVLKDKDKR